MEKLNAIDMLKQYAKRYLSIEAADMKFGWGVDFAYCSVLPSPPEKDTIILMAFENPDGTVEIAETEEIRKYLKNREMITA